MATRGKDNTPKFTSQEYGQNLAPNLGVGLMLWVKLGTGQKGHSTFKILDLRPKGKWQESKEEWYGLGLYHVAQPQSKVKGSLLLKGIGIKEDQDK